MVEIEQFFEDYEVGMSRNTVGRTITETDIVMHAMHSEIFIRIILMRNLLKKDLLVNVLRNLVVLSP